jgi:hypothetical protein
MPRLPVRGATFFRWVALAPFVVPVAGAALCGLLGLLGVPGAGQVMAWFGFLAAAAWIGGLPYLAIAAIVLWRLRRAGGAAHARAARWVPLPFAALMMLIFFCFALSEEQTAMLQALAIGAAWGAAAFVVGYLYALIALAFYRVAMRRRWVTD